MRQRGPATVTKSKTIYSEGFHLPMPGVFSLSFPYWHQLGVPVDTPGSKTSEMCLNQLSLLLSQATAPHDTAAILVETVMGEGGYVPAPPEFLKSLCAVCDKHGIMHIIDEGQSGYGRTGKNYAIEYSGVRPDIIITANLGPCLANGFLLSGVTSRKELTDKLQPGSMGGTYAGEAVACAAADVMKEEKIPDNVDARSRELFAAPNALRANPKVAPAILDVRG
ncbi:hypothetical protein BN946_scf185042.g139 [Trametes cinnabarina]|uniref:Uncharacterized protein n=1 Tax=Pycnoporus cinnabarinus TaxID=5643 RepID=A0A060S490_PYCCI|nr:hypothetical protein BN946_scf185042.g139 [Trametes cinnabarina]